MSHNLVRGVLPSVAILFCACVWVGALAVKAQTPPAPDPTPAALESLSRSSQTVIQQLSTLSNLQVDDWRFHAGDIAHGELPSLDDSKWEVKKAETVVPPDSVWFRRWIEVPKNLNGYDLTGSQITFQFQVDVNGPFTTIVYLDGRRVAMGEDLEPIVL